ncbi:MAG TPA: hypothetical protein VFJ94_08935 [Intrasporangium sp.]|uniref:hypothetical protein n=1 Tax=Intrasporangium sp. TaxID=1925024 RepID=UPI002D7A052F|nr:hypothetical protein [Intrasporangium sp.]HET7398634.1 hypothetical protein [Intrasporangium sp.]
MLIAAGLCPHPPLLLDGLRGSVDPVPELRAACADVASWVRGRAEEAGARVVVVAGGPRTRSHGPDEPSSAAAFLGTRRASDPEELPYAVALGRQLLTAAGCRVDALQAVALGEPVAGCVRLGASLVSGPEPVVLLVLADGSARRTQKAPGYLDPRAAGFDAAWVGAVRAGDPQPLLDLDPQLAAELLCEGRAALQILAGAALQGAAGRRMAAGVPFADDPFGVQYVAATWHFL